MTPFEVTDGQASDFERIGEEALKSAIDDFVDRCFADMMIGYMFPEVRRDRIKRFEFEHAAEHLGSGSGYGGRPIDKAHAALRIMGGHFDRRLMILRETLVDHNMPEDIIERWLAYHESLRTLVTQQGQGICR